jgi:hypothetical protein
VIFAAQAEMVNPKIIRMEITVTCILFIFLYPFFSMLNIRIETIYRNECSPKENVRRFVCLIIAS